MSKLIIFSALIVLVTMASAIPKDYIRERRAPSHRHPFFDVYYVAVRPKRYEDRWSHGSGHGYHGSGHGHYGSGHENYYPHHSQASSYASAYSTSGNRGGDSWSQAGANGGSTVWGK